MAERRRYPRIARAVDATWRGSSGAHNCRLADISLGGCFVQTLASPGAGERTAVTLRLGDEDTLTLPGVVRYAERGTGFAVQFLDITEIDRKTLAAFIEGL